MTDRMNPVSALIATVVIAIVGCLLVGDAPFGIAFPLWIASIVAMAYFLARRAQIVLAVDMAFFAGAALLFSSGIAFRDALLLGLLNCIATFFALVCLAGSCGRQKSLLFSSSLVDIAKSIIAVCGAMVTGIVPLVANALIARREKPGGNIKRIVRACVMAGIIVTTFLLLLRAADPIFASFVSLPALDAGKLLRHLLITGIFTAGIGGAVYFALSQPIVDDNKPTGAFFQFGFLELMMLLGALNVLFAAFVLTQLGWFFGGESFLHAHTDVSVAEFARAGFFQIVVVVVLIFPVLLISRWTIAHSVELRRWHSRLSIPILSFLMVMIASAVMKMQLYVSYYALTTERFYTLIFLLWLGFVLVWLLCTTLRDQPLVFPRGVIFSGAMALLLLNIFIPDRIVATINISRGDTLDYSYLTRLSGDAMDLIVDAIITKSGPPEQRCEAALAILDRWPLVPRDAEKTSWRFFNVGDVHARRVVQMHRRALHDTCITHEKNF